MKKLFHLLALTLIVFMVSSCSQGSAAIDKAYQQACEAAPAEKIATTLCNGDIKCMTLTSEEAAKLGAVLQYLSFHGMYSADFEAQVDMYQFGKLLDGYRDLEKNMTGSERLKIEELVKNIEVSQ